MPLIVLLSFFKAIIAAAPPVVLLCLAWKTSNASVLGFLLFFGADPQYSSLILSLEIWIADNAGHHTFLPQLFLLHPRSAPIFR